MKELTIYSKPNCVYCTSAKDYLKQLEIPFTEVDVIDNQEKLDWLRNQGFKQLPVIFAGDDLLAPGGWSTLKTMRKHEILERLNTDE